VWDPEKRDALEKVSLPLEPPFLFQALYANAFSVYGHVKGRVGALRDENTMERTENFPTYVFATVNPGRSTKVVEELKHHNRVDLIAPITGKFDLALRLKHSSPTEVYEEIKKIREIPGVRTTITHTVFEGIQSSKKIENEKPLGFTLLNIEKMPFKEAINELGTIPGLVEAFTVDGDCDIVALWQGRTTEEIMKNSFEKLNGLEGFHNHETLFVRTPFFKP
jgi:DNA-binding Lrp family transcriptional regulator